MPSALTIRFRPVDALPCTSIDAQPPRAALRALRVTDAVSKYSRPSWCRNNTNARWMEPSSLRVPTAATRRLASTSATSSEVGWAR